MSRRSAAEWWTWAQDRCASSPGRPPSSPGAFKSSSSQQGHLTRFLSFGLGLSVTAIEADPALVAMATKFDTELVCALEKEKQKTVSLFAFPAASGPNSMWLSWIPAA